MAHREVTMLEVKEVLRLWLSRVPKKRIAAQLGFHVKTARRYIAAAARRGLERHGGTVQLDDDLVAALMEELRPLVGRPHGEGWERCHPRRDLIERHHGLSKIV